MNIEEKKAGLKKYKYYQEELERLYYKLNEIRVKCYGKAGVQAITYSDMPKGGTSPDMADEIAKMIDLEKGIIKNILDLHEKINKINEAIDGLSNIEQKRIIKLYYIDGLSFRKMEKEIHLSKSKIFDIFNEGLKMLQVKKDNLVQN